MLKMNVIQSTVWESSGQKRCLIKKARSQITSPLSGHARRPLKIDSLSITFFGKIKKKEKKTQICHLGVCT